MMKFVKYQNEENQFDTVKRVIFKTEAETLSTVLEDFTDFLMACGFRIKGTIVIDEDEE